jgi:hypothetical protein
MPDTSRVNDDSALRQLIVKLYRGEGGQSIDADTIAVELGLSKADVKSVLIGAGFTLAGPRAPTRAGFLMEDVATVEAEYVRGVPIRDIAKAHNVSPNRIYELLEADDIPLRSYSLSTTNAKARRDAEIIEAYAPMQPDGTRDSRKGLQVSDIVSMTGVSQMTIHNVIHANHIPLRLTRVAKRFDTTVLLRNLSPRPQDDIPAWEPWETNKED